MKKKALFLLPFLVLGLSGCNDVDDEDISFAPGTVIPDPEQHTGEGHGEDQTTDDSEGPTITGITEVVSAPEKIDIEDGIEVTDVKVRVTLSNGSTLVRCPNSLTYDTTGKVAGDPIEVTAHIFEFTISFNCVLYEQPRDILTPDLPGAPSSKTYARWSYNGEAKYDIVSSLQNSDLTLSDSAKDPGFPGIVSTHSAGRIKKISVEWDYEKTAEDATLLIFTSVTPFADTNDLSAFKKTDAFTTTKKTETTFTYTFTEEQDFFYIGFKANSGANYFKSITVFWDDSKTAPELESMEFTAESSVRAETGGSSWDYSNVKVSGTYEGDVTVDITKLVDLSSTTPIPAEPIEEMDVSVLATYKRDTSKTYLADLKGNVTQGMLTVQNFAYGESAIGGTQSLQGFGNDSSYKGYKETGDADTECYIQVLANSPLWTTSPTKIVVKAKIGYGKDSPTTFESPYQVYAVLLNNEGEVGSRVMLTDTLSTKAGEEFSVEFPATNNVYGFRIVHQRKSGTVMRFYSGSLRKL